MRLIDADVLIKELEWLEDDRPVFNDVMRTIDKVPSVDAVPVDFLWKLRDHAQNEEAKLMIEEIFAQWRYRHKIKASTLYGEMKEDATD